jgi:hypothetical protein
MTWPSFGSSRTSEPRDVGGVETNSSPVATPMATLWPTRVAEPQICASGLVLGSTRHRTAPVSVSSP